MFVLRRKAEGALGGRGRRLSLPLSRVIEGIPCIRHARSTESIENKILNGGSVLELRRKRVGKRRITQPKTRNKTIQIRRKKNKPPTTKAVVETKSIHTMWWKSQAACL